MLKSILIVVAAAALVTAAPGKLADISRTEFTAEGAVVVMHNAIDIFPLSKGDLSAWDVAARFRGYNQSMKSWLTAQDPHSGTTGEEKAQILMSVAYAKPFDHGDADMAGDVADLLGAIAGETPDQTAARLTLEGRDSRYIISKAHVILWHACQSFFSCVSGTTCHFDIQVGKAPRSECQSQGGQSCCISWSTYKVQAGFFSRTWTNCNAEVNNEHLSSASCEGKGSNKGGDVCLSNRASGCT